MTKLSDAVRKAGTDTYTCSPYDSDGDHVERIFHAMQAALDAESGYTILPPAPIHRAIAAPRSRGFGDI